MNKKNFICVFIKGPTQIRFPLDLTLSMASPAFMNKEEY